MSKFVDLTGKKFERLTVIRKVEKPENLKTEGSYWLCECDCGNKIITISSHLNSGHTKSCGCLLIDMLKISRRKYNKYELKFENIGIAYDIKTDDPLFMFDWEDLELIKNYAWYNDGKYIAANDLSGNNSKIRLHRLIMSNFLDIFITDLGIIDHINRNIYDTRKENMRLVTQQQNAINKSMLSSNTTGFMGISFLKSRKKFEVGLKFGKKLLHLGKYKNLRDAVIARLNAEKKYFGEYAPQRHLFKEYGIE